MDIFNLVGRIAIDGINNVRSQISGVISEASKAGQSIGSAFQNVGSAMTGLGAKLTGALTTPIAGVTLLGVKYNATMQSLQTDFKVMLGSQEKAVAMTKKLIDLGASTPFESQDLAQATKTMLSFGYTGENVIPIMTRLGDVALGDNTKFQSLTRTMGQINALGKLQGGDLNQLIGQGWNPLNEIMKKTGESTEQVRKRMEEGKITYKEVEEALIATTSKGGTFYQGMAEGSKTFQGQLSTLMDTFNMFIGDLTKPIFDQLMIILPKVIEILGSLGEKFKNLSPEMKNVVLVIGGIVASIGPLLVAIGSVVGVIGGAIAGISSIAGALAGMSPIILAVIASLPQLFIELSLIIGVFVAVGGSIAYVLQQTGAFSQMWDILKSTIALAKPIIEDVAMNAFEKLKLAISTVKGVLDDISIVMQPFINQTLAGAKPIIADIVVALGAFANAVIDALGTKISQAKALWDQYWPSMKPVVINMCEIIMTTIITTLNVIKQVIQTATAIIKGDWSTAWNHVKSIFSSIWNGINSALQSAMNALIYTVGNAIKKLPGIIFSIHNAVVGKAVEIGTAIVNGIVNGIKGGLKWVKNAASEIADSAVKAAKSTLGIKSPSTVFQEIGDYVTQGFVIGVDENKIKSTMDSIANVVKMPFNSQNLILDNTSTRSMISQSSPSSSNNGGDFVINGNIVIDESNIKELNDVLDIFRNLKSERIARGGAY